MTLCSGGGFDQVHEEICYEGKNCPLCETLKTLEETQKTVDTLEDTLRQYE
jgi:hypothetical protein